MSTLRVRIGHLEASHAARLPRTGMGDEEMAAVRARIAAFVQAHEPEVGAEADLPQRIESLRAELQARAGQQP